MKIASFSIQILLLILLMSGNIRAEQNRHLNFDDNWKFHLGDTINASQMTFDDSQWQQLDLPHDWSIETPFAKDSEGGIATGHFIGGTGWYRKTFILRKEQKDKLLQLYFEGAYTETEVWLNGKKIANHLYGYTPFYCDITSFCNPSGKENTLAVKVRNQGKNSRWYTGSGIYRHVWMITTEKMHLEANGVSISTPVVSKEKAVIHVTANLVNQTNKRQQTKTFIQLKNSSNTIVSEKIVKADLNAGEKKTILQDLEVQYPDLWSVDSPALYSVTVSLSSEHQKKDETVTSFGIRSISSSAREGFLLNGNPLKLKGGCVHHDNGLLGAASIDRAEERKAELLKANGFNAVRCAHNPPSEKFLEACDRIGLLVIDEAFDQWQKQKNPDDYHRFFNERHEQDLSSMVLRDRNHPSVIMWSIGNEIQERSDSSGIEIAQQLKSIIHKYDTTRPVTSAVNDFWDNPHLKWEDSKKVFSQLDVCGYNYMWWEYENDHRAFPERVIYGSESTAMERTSNWDLVENSSYIIGDFIWTAIDYLGESGIGHVLQVKNGDEEPSMFLGWPWFNAWCGDIDICGNKKPQTLLRDVVWNKSKIEMAVHQPITDGSHEKVSYWGWPEEYPDWNWKGQEGQSLQVRVFTSYSTVRLYLNGKLLEEKTVSSENKTKYIAEFQVHYQPGELKAVGVENGQEKESIMLKTTGLPAKIKLIPDHMKIQNSRNDLCYVNIELTDSEGYVVPDQDCLVSLSVVGNGEIAASGNASPTDMKSFRSPNPETYRGKALVILRPIGKQGSITLKVKADNLAQEQITIKCYK